MNRLDFMPLTQSEAEFWYDLSVETEDEKKQDNYEKVEKTIENNIRDYRPAWVKRWF